MIKCNVTVCGTVTRAVELRSSQEGKPFITFKMTVPIPTESDSPRQTEISVIKDGNEESCMSQFPVNSKVLVTGILTFNLKGNNVYFNLRAESITPQGEAQEGISGTMDFWGTVGKQTEKKISSKEKEYLLFTAYSTQKEGETLLFQWVRFMDFSGKNDELIKEKASIKVTGTFEAKYYKERLDLSCFAKEVKPWERKKNQPEIQKQ